MSIEDPNWNDDIYPTFVGYAPCMKQQKGLDISDYNVVKSKAKDIHYMISKQPPSFVQRMPPDIYLGDDFVGTFENWMKNGFKESKES